MAAQVDLAGLDPHTRAPHWGIPSKKAQYPSTRVMRSEVPRDSYTYKRLDYQQRQPYTGRWHDEVPYWQTDYARHGPQTCSTWKYEFNHEPKASLKTYRPAWEPPYLLKEYFMRGQPDGEAIRARGQYSIRRHEEVDSTYQWSNNMTQNNRRPILSIYGPMLQKQLHGVRHQHNRHGNMPFEDYY